MKVVLLHCLIAEYASKEGGALGRADGQLPSPAHTSKLFVPGYVEIVMVTLSDMTYIR